MNSLTKPIMVLVCSLPLLGIGGCDRTVETSEKQSSGPNGVTVEKKTVTEDPNGNVSVTKEKTDQTHNP